MKSLYCGYFNYAHELIILYCYAYSIIQAREIFFRRLAKMHNVEVWRVRQIFDGSKPNFEVKIECKFTEIENEEEKSVNGIS